MDAKLTGKVLKALRESKGLSQQQVADYLQINRTAYVKYETGKSKPTRKLKELSELYCVPVDYFWGKMPQYEEVGQPKQPGIDFKWDTQLFSNPNADPANVSFAMGKVLTLKNDEAKKLTLQIMDEVLRLTIPQLEALGAFLKTIK